MKLIKSIKAILKKWKFDRWVNAGNRAGWITSTRNMNSRGTINCNLPIKNTVTIKPKSNIGVKPKGNIRVRPPIKNTPSNMRKKKLPTKNTNSRPTQQNRPKPRDPQKSVKEVISMLENNINPLDITPKDIPKEVPKDVPNIESKKATKDVPKEVPKEALKDIPEENKKDNGKDDGLEKEQSK